MSEPLLVLERMGRIADHEKWSHCRLVFERINGSDDITAANRSTLFRH